MTSEREKDAFVVSHNNNVYSVFNVTQLAFKEYIESLSIYILHITLIFGRKYTILLTGLLCMGILTVSVPLIEKY